VNDVSEHETGQEPARSRESEAGASAVEYGLLIAGIAALIVVVVFAFGGNLSEIFDNTCKTVGDGTSSTATGTC
jgi:pilus assembly protein Flp/PilA